MYNIDGENRMKLNMDMVFSRTERGEKQIKINK
jgi:hypothetical protein